MIGGGAAAKYTSESYDILRCNCNHFTEDLCMAVCGKQVCARRTLWRARPLSLSSQGLALLPLRALSCPPPRIRSPVCSWAKGTEVSKTVWQAEGCEHCNSKAVLHLLQQQGSTPLVATARQHSTCCKAGVATLQLETSLQVHCLLGPSLATPS
jgi:hypothetical protein